MKVSIKSLSYLFVLSYKIFAQLTFFFFYIFTSISVLPRLRRVSFMELIRQDINTAFLLCFVLSILGLVQQSTFFQYCVLRRFSIRLIGSFSRLTQKFSRWFVIFLKGTTRSIEYCIEFLNRSHKLNIVVRAFANFNRFSNNIKPTSLHLRLPTQNCSFILYNRRRDLYYQ